MSLPRIVQLKVGFVHLYKSAQTKTRRHSDIALQSTDTRWAGHRNMCDVLWCNVVQMTRSGVLSGVCIAAISGDQIFLQSDVIFFTDVNIKLW